MTSFRIERIKFAPDHLAVWSQTDPRFHNWPVVYTLDGGGKVYVGESRNVAARFRQHLDSEERRALERARVIIDETFNKSACLDLESYLIRLFAGDGKFQVLNRNDGVLDADYYERARYQATFDEVFAELRDLGLFTREVRDIENSDLFKLSPFKALTPDQAIAVEDILDGLFEDLEAEKPSTIVIQGDPGTGKTVIAVYLMKLLMDIKKADLTEPTDSDTMFSDFFVEGYPELLLDFRVGLVVPQQSLRKSVQRVFMKTPGLDRDMVLSPFDVGLSEERFNLLVVDETHRLNHRANQPSGMQNLKFAQINARLFGADDPKYTQLDWVREQSDHQVFLLDAAQSVRPADLPPAVLESMLEEVNGERRHYVLTSQLRVEGGADYVTYIRRILGEDPPERQRFPSYDFRLFTDLGEMTRALTARQEETGLARLVAGYAWEWRSKNDKSLYDIELDGVRLQWNTAVVDWVNSPEGVREVGSIHTIQGYDLNYAGVIIGRDLRWDTKHQRLIFDRSQYFDRKGMENNPQLGITYSDEDLLRFVTNIYSVLLTRGIKGTYVYVCDPLLREHLSRFIPCAD
ncbi:MAG TPA: DNA/RNA helicase domain-containing protein [Propionibacteriaceae bacterium]|nr:DNA/RNA helicase domain-containing protein [Propionibacteriaceae bacterium]